MIKDYLIWMGIIVIALFVLDITTASLRSGIVEKEEEKVIIYFPKSADFPNSEQGSVTFTFNFPSAYFKVGNKSADYLLFLDSDTVAGLKVGYDVKERKVKAGLPLISSVEVDIIDGQEHTLTYVFDKKIRRQSIFVDSQIVADGEFTGQEMEKFSGYAVYERCTMIESGLGMDVGFG